MNIWLVTWNGNITRDRGQAYVVAVDAVGAEEKFTRKYPTRHAEKVERLGSVIQ